MRKTVLILILSLLMFNYGCENSSNDGSNSNGGGSSYVAEEATFYVSIKGADVDGNGDPEKPYKTIQYAIDNAPVNHKIYVAAGTYNETIILKDTVSLYGGFNADDWADQNNINREEPKYRTLIDAKKYCAVTNITIDPDTSNTINIEIGNNTIIDGFSIAGSATVFDAADCSSGIKLAGNASPTIINNTINGGSGTKASVAIDTESEASPVIANNKIYGGNSSLSSYGMRFSNSKNGTPKVYNNIIFAGNKRSNTSSGIMTAGACVKIYCNTIILGNSINAYGISEPVTTGGKIIIENNIIVSISEKEEAADKRYGIYSLAKNLPPMLQPDGPGFPASIKNNNIFKCTNALYQQGTSGTPVTDIDDLNTIAIAEGNVSVEPKFVSEVDLHLTLDSPEEIREGGKDLSGLAADFPGIDKDCEGTPRTLPWSIGAYEID